MDRRSILHTSAAAAVGAVAGCALPGTAATAPRTPFTVPATHIPIVGSEMMSRERRICCIGRKHAAHAREIGSDPTRGPPCFFQKPADAIQNVAPGTAADHPHPPLIKNGHCEVEPVTAIAKGGMGDQKKPWEIGKSFDRSARIGPLHPVTGIGHFAKGAIWLKVNGQLKQDADLNQMIWNVADRSLSCPRPSI